MYHAVVCRIKTHPHPNADRIQLGTCLGNQVVVGLDTQDGELGVFFRTDGQLSAEFAAANDLIRRKDPVTGARAGGFFEANRRVRAQKFRGEISDGFWCPLSYLAFTGVRLETLEEGVTFDALSGVPICNKYETPATRAHRGQGKRVQHRRETPMFRMHVDTNQFREVADRLPPGSVVTLTEKLHGTSHRFGYVEDVYKHNWWERLFRRLWNVLPGVSSIPVAESIRWVYLSGTRRVILQGTKAVVPGASDDNFRLTAIRGLQGNLHPGEVIYLEIVGYTSTGALISMPQSIGKLQDKKRRSQLQDRYGPKMRYTYGCVERECRPYVYRIVQAAFDGYQVELSWPQIKRRCAELGIEHVPELCGPRTVVSGHIRFEASVTLKQLREQLDMLVDCPSTLCNRHIREGVAIRVDYPDGTTKWYKQKSWLFGVLEGYLKEDETYVDREEVS